MKFGTGAVKVTPAHDFNDYDIAKRHNLPMKQVIGFDGRLNEHAGKYKGMKVNAARIQIAQDMQTMGLIEKIKEDYTHRVGTCYKCARVLEPLPKEQWFIKIKPLADSAKKLIKEKKTVIFPKRFEKQLIRILDNYIDWNISRQVVWGIRIQAYKCSNLKFEIRNLNSNSKLKIENSNSWFVSEKKQEKCQICGECDFVQDEDTFDTWFSSAQWPFATLETEKKDFFNYFYPTSIMETGHDIMRAWVARMMMIGDFVTDKPPFKTVFLHGMVRDGKGQKMSKSRGNVIDPLLLMDKYGEDALRAALIFGTKEGGDVSLSEEKVKGMRNFANKIWNVGRFIELNSNIQYPISNIQIPISNVQTPISKLQIINDLKKEAKDLKKRYMLNMKK